MMPEQVGGDLPGVPVIRIGETGDDLGGHVEPDAEAGEQARLPLVHDGVEGAGEREVPDPVEVLIRPPFDHGDDLRGGSVEGERRRYLRDEIAVELVVLVVLVVGDRVEFLRPEEDTVPGGAGPQRRVVPALDQQEALADADEGPHRRVGFGGPFGVGGPEADDGRRRRVEVDRLRLPALAGDEAEVSARVRGQTVVEGCGSAGEFALLELDLRDRVDGPRLRAPALVRCPVVAADEVALAYGLVVADEGSEDRCAPAGR
jgi:hypothetical protein